MSSSYILPLVLNVIQLSLERRTELLASWMAFWTYIVAVGLMLEVAEGLLGPLVRKCGRKEKRLLAWLTAYSITGLILVGAGVAGELYIEFEAPIAEAKLRELNDASNVSLRKQASDAQERAAANEKEAARLNKLAQHEMMERVKLERLLQGRTLSKEQEARLVKRLKPLAGLVVDVIVLDDQEDQSSRDEASALGSSLVNVLQEAGLNTAGFVPMDCPTMSLVGIAVTSPNDPMDQREKAGDLFKALSAEVKTLPYVASWTIPNCHFSSLPNATNSRLMTANIRVLIGRKPVPILKSEEPSLKK